MTEWQPIESAPKDGTPVWLTDFKEVVSAWFLDDHRPEWRPTAVNSDFETYEILSFTPTHWTLPDPPKEK